MLRSEHDTAARDRQLRAWKLVFYAAAAYNLLAAAVALAAPRFHADRFFTEAIESSGAIAQVDTQGFWVFVLLFGVGYALVARDPSKNHALVLLAALGKTYVFGAWAWHWFQGTMTTFALLGGIGDLLFAGAFLAFLWRVNL